MVFSQRGYGGLTKLNECEKVLKGKGKEWNDEQVTKQGSEWNWI